METISHDPHEDDASLHEELVAYLDGELSVEHSRRIEERALLEPRTRRMLEDFDRTWHLLDELESPATNEDLARTTLEMVALAAAADAERAKAAAPRARWRRRLWTIAGLVVAAATGFALVAVLAPDPNAQLLQELPLLENLDQYRAVGSIEFLRALEADNPFPKEVDTAQPALGSGTAESIAQRRHLVDEMTVVQREDLFHNEDKFFHDSQPEERRRLRELYAAVQRDPQREKLLTLMKTYWEWYDAQPLTDRNEQKTLDPAKRVAKVKEQLNKESLAGNQIHLDEKSKAGLIHWMDFYTTKHEARIVQDWAKTRGGRPFGGPLRPSPSAGPESNPAAILSKFPPQRKREIVRNWLQRNLRSANAAKNPPISTDEMANLRDSLSPDVQNKFDEIHKQEEQFRIIASWLQPLRLEPEDQLVAFFETTLDAEQRDRLMALPVDKMYLELGRMYLAAGGGPRPGEQWTNRPDRGGRRGNRPGAGPRRRMDDPQMREPPPLGPKGEQSPLDSAANKPGPKAKD